MEERERKMGNDDDNDNDNTYTHKKNIFTPIPKRLTVCILFINFGTIEIICYAISVSQAFSKTYVFDCENHPFAFLILSL